MTATALLKHSFWTTYGAIATRLLALLSNLILARLLTPEAFGVIGIAYIFWGLVNLLTQGTMGDFIVYKGLGDRRYLNTAFTVTSMVAITGAILMLIAAPWIGQFLQMPFLPPLLGIFAFNFVLSALQSFYAGVLNRRMQYSQLANATLMAALVRLSMTTGCALAGASYWSFAIGDCAYWLLLFGLTYYHARIKFRLQLDPSVRSEVMQYCTGAIGSSLGFYFNANADSFIVGRILGSVSLGYYNFAYQLTMAIATIFSQVMGQLGTSTFAQLEGDRNQEKALRQVSETLAFLAAPIFALFYLVVNPSLIGFIFGEKWIPACAVFPGLLIFAYFRVFNAPLISMLAAKGRPDINAEVNLLIAPIAILGFFWGAKNGIWGVSIAAAILLGLIWTIYWWWMGCSALKWSSAQFLLPGFKAAAIAITTVTVAMYAQTLLAIPLSIPVFILFYLAAIAHFALPQFQQFILITRRSLHYLQHR
jgi:lipopolysaccharide exporter